MALITAKELRSLSSIDVDQALEKLNPILIKHAKNGRTSCRAGLASGDLELWCNGGYDNSPDWLEAKEKLELAGYKVTFVYEDGNQFSMMYTLIEW